VPAFTTSRCTRCMPRCPTHMSRCTRYMQEMFHGSAPLSAIWVLARKWSRPPSLEAMLAAGGAHRLGEGLLAQGHLLAPGELVEGKGDRLERVRETGG